MERDGKVGERTYKGPLLTRSIESMKARFAPQWLTSMIRSSLRIEVTASGC